MPKNRFADVRYHVLDQCLRDRTRYYTIYDLSEKCSEAIFRIDEEERNPISIKQIRNDLHHLESEAGYQAEIVSEKLPGDKKHYFRYADPDFTISKRPLSDQDIANLKSTFHILQRFKGLHNEDWINEFAARIESIQGVAPDKDSGPNEIIKFEHEDLFRGSEWIVPLYRAIEKRHAICILYEPFGKPRETYHVSPYLLRQYNRRWFLLCKSKGLDHVTTLPLDRIMEINPTTVAYQPFEGDQPSDFFDDIIGVINKPGEAVLDITLEVEKDLIAYIEKKLIHSSQKMKRATDDPNWFRVGLRLKPNYEFYAVILSHGPKVRIVSPESVKGKMKSLIQEMANHYQ